MLKEIKVFQKSKEYDDEIVMIGETIERLSFNEDLKAAMESTGKRPAI